MGGCACSTRLWMLIAAAPIFLLLLVPVASAYSVTLNGAGASVLKTQAWDGFGGYASETVNPVALPYSYTSASSDWTVTSESVYSFSGAGFNITFDHSRAIALNNYAQSDGSIYFNVDENVDYHALGSYSVLDSDGRRVYLYTYLEDMTAVSFSFRSLQESRSTPNESFSLGHNGGDLGNINFGSLSGTLIAGHDYRFGYYAFIQANPTASTTGATATGSISLSFAPVPEPSTALLLAIGLSGIALRNRRS